MSNQSLFNLGFIVSLIALSAGGGILYQSWRASPAPVVMQCDDYLRSRPNIYWVDLRNCTLDYEQAIVLYNARGFNRVGSVYIPVVRQIGDKNIVLLLKIPGDQSLHFGRKLSPEQVAANSGKLSELHRQIRGLVSKVADSDDEQLIERSVMPLAEDWKVIEEVDPFPRELGFGLLTIPLAFGLFAAWRSRRKALDKSEA